MFIKYFKLILIILFYYQTPLYSKSISLDNFNSDHFSNYFSGIIAYENKSNSDALEFFKSSKFLIKKHKPYLKRYIYSLVLENKVKEAAKEIRQNLEKDNSKFFEAFLILSLDSIKKKDYKKSKEYLAQASNYIDNDRYELIIYESLEQYLYLFEENEILDKEKKFGNLSLINEVFQRCYLEDSNTQKYFSLLFNNINDGDYSRYIFFNLLYLIENEKFEEAKLIASQLDYLKSSLLISQGKKWIEEKKLEKFNKIFSCKNPNDIISEFIFLIANLYSSQDNYEKSNFYLNISYFLNPKFNFNQSLIIENYYLNENYKKAKKALDYFDEDDDFYYWFKIKKLAQIISKEVSEEASLNFINEKFKAIKNPSIKIIFDIANFNKNSKKYQKAISYYDQVILMIELDSDVYADLLYRRGSCYERLKNYVKSDKDFLESLLINPDDAYVLNYLAYSWLERKYKIDKAIQMLEKAYAERNNDPYIIDSIGWAYYLTDDFLKAEVFLKRAVELMPYDPTVIDHYGDILWKLDRKIEARYFWTSVLDLKETEEKMKENVNFKLIKGLKNL